MKPEQKKAIRVTALTAALLALVLSIWVYFSYDKAAAGYQFIEKYNWMPLLGISLHFGVDGLSAPLVLADWHRDGHGCDDLLGY